MPTAVIPFGSENKNADEGMQNALTVELFNAIIDELGHLRRVPGYSSFADLATGAKMDGLWYNEKNDKVIAVSGQKVFYIEEDGTTTDITNTGIPALGTLCTFADFADDVYIANGVQIIKAPVDATTKTTFVTDTDAPTDALFVANLNDYLLANNGLTGRIDFADTGTPETWAGEFFSFDNSNDQLQFMSVGEGHDRIYGFGTKSIDPYKNSGNTPFIPVGQEYLSRGSISKYSPVFIKDQWYFLDQFKNLCRVRGRTPQELPTKNYRGLTAALQGLYCEDAESLWVYSNGYHWYVCNLPTEERTFAYNIDLDQYAEWSYWKLNTGEHQQWRGRCSTYATGWQKTLIGDSRSGVIYQMSPETFTANSDVIRSSIKTGFINRGDDTKTKFCNRIYGRVVKKNVNGGDDTLKVAIRWRDDMLESSWKQEEVELFTEDGLNYYYFINGLGSYTSRQWEIICTSNIDFQMSAPTENYDESYQ
jgi:hypothetical protein